LPVQPTADQGVMAEEEILQASRKTFGKKNIMDDFLATQNTGIQFTSYQSTADSDDRSSVDEVDIARG